MPMCAWECRRTRLTLGFFLPSFIPFFISLVCLSFPFLSWHHLLPNLEFINLATLTGPFCLWLSKTTIAVTHHHAWLFGWILGIWIQILIFLVASNYLLCSSSQFPVSGQCIVKSVLCWYNLSITTLSLLFLPLFYRSFIFPFLSVAMIFNIYPQFTDP